MLDYCVIWAVKTVCFALFCIRVSLGRKELPTLIVYYVALGYQAEISFDVMFDKEKATSSYYVQSC